MKQTHDDFDETQLFSEPTSSIKPEKPVMATTKPSSNNPLSAYFRIPGLHITLPTRGRFFSEENYSESLGGDIPIFPMRAADELLLKTPDALMNGYALEKLIESCVPSIKEPREVSTPDLDVILLAIRAATYGNNMELEIECPECEGENSFDCNLSEILGTITYVDPENEIRINDEVIMYVRPYTLASAVRITMATFNAAQKIRSVEELDDKIRTETLNGSYSHLSSINISAIADSIISIIVPNNVVTDKTHIFEYISNTDKVSFKKIEDKLAEINSKGIDKKINAVCSHCGHSWVGAIEFDPSSFFGIGS